MRLLVEIQARLPAFAAEAAPFPAEGCIAEQRRFKRQHVVAMHVAVRVDPLEHQDLKQNNTHQDVAGQEALRTLPQSVQRLF